MSYSFHLPKVETRSKKIDGTPVYIVKGYATAPNHIYNYKTVESKDGKIRTFKEYFTEEAIENIRRKIKNEKIFVDAEHIISSKSSADFILDQIQKKVGTDFVEEIDHIKNKFKYADIPMFKVDDIKIDDKGLFVDIRGNPYYREIDTDHRKYFDAVWSSLENGFINGMSLNFKPTENGIITQDGISKINDVDIYGISLTGSASNDMAPITEVAMRSIEHVRGEAICQKIISKTSLMM